MKKTYRSDKYLKWIRELGCTTRSLSCNGPIQAHHLLRPWAGGRGMGMRADDRNVIPLCMYHHHTLHTKHGDEYSFFESHFRRPDYGQDLARTLYERGVDMGLIKDS